MGHPINSQGNKFTRLLCSLKVENPIELDSTCNGLSIIGCLLGDKSLLKATNVIIDPSEEHNNLPKKDIYMIILNDMLLC